MAVSYTHLHTTLLKTDERAKECPQCGLINYPQLAPAVIILIEKDNEILLARSPRFKPEMYSVIACLLYTSNDSLVWIFLSV